MPVKVKREMVSETACELMDDHNEKIADNKIRQDILFDSHDLISLIK